MKQAHETVAFLDSLIQSYVAEGSSAGTPEATESVLRNIDLVREVILTDLSHENWGLPVYSIFLFRNDCGSISFCANLRYSHRDAPLPDDEVLARLREFWRTYIDFERRPKSV